jgi:hypothetical protein
MLPIAFVVALCYAWADWKYIKSGGKRPTPAEILAWLIGVVVILLAASAVMFFILGIREPQEFVNDALTVLASVFVLSFILYEARRWQVRRANPIGQNQPGSIPN